MTRDEFMNEDDRFGLLREVEQQALNAEELGSPVDGLSPSARWYREAALESAQDHGAGWNGALLLGLLSVSRAIEEAGER